MIPASTRLVRLVRVSFFSHLTIGKSLSTVVVLGNAVANPPQNWRRPLNRPLTTSHASLKNVFSSCWSNALATCGSLSYTARNCRCSFSMSSICYWDQCFERWTRYGSNTSWMNVARRILTRFAGITGGASNSRALLFESRSAYTCDTFATIEIPKIVISFKVVCLSVSEKALYKSQTQDPWSWMCMMTESFRMNQSLHVMMLADQPLPLPHRWRGGCPDLRQYQRPIRHFLSLLRNHNVVGLDLGERDCNPVKQWWNSSCNNPPHFRRCLNKAFCSLVDH